MKRKPTLYLYCFINVLPLPLFGDELMALWKAVNCNNGEVSYFLQYLSENNTDYWHLMRVSNLATLSFIMPFPDFDTNVGRGTAVVDISGENYSFYVGLLNPQNFSKNSEVTQNCGSTGQRHPAEHIDTQ